MSVLKNETGLARPWIIVISIAALLAASGIGYMIGKDKGETDAKAKYDQQVQTLESDLDAARDAVSDDIQEGQEAITEGQQTLESLQAENAQLKTTIEQQNAKIADLEKQLDEAQSETPPAEQ